MATRTRLQMYNQHDRTTPHFTRNDIHYLDEQFPDRWIGPGGPQN